MKALLVAGCFLAVLPAGEAGECRAAQEADPPAAKAARPIKGTRVVDVDRDATDEVAWIRVQVLSDTPSGATWNVIQNVEQWDRFMDLYAEVRVLRGEGPVTVYEFTVSPPWPIADAKTVVRILKKPADRTLDYWVEQGFMQGTYGKVSVEKVDGGCRILFENLGSPNQRFPDWMVKIGVYLVMPSVLEDIRKQVLLEMQARERAAGVSTPYP